MQTRNLKLDYLESLPTITVGQTDDLKIETEDTRVWLSRMTVEDGERCDNLVSVEKLNEGGRWVIDYTYQAL